MSKLLLCPHCSLSIYQYEIQCPHCHSPLSADEFTQDMSLDSSIQAIYGAPPWLMAKFKVSNLTIPLQYTACIDPLIKEMQSLLKSCDTSLFPPFLSFQLDFDVQEGVMTELKFTPTDLAPEFQKEITIALDKKTISCPVSGTIFCTIIFEY